MRAFGARDRTLLWREHQRPTGKRYAAKRAHPRIGGSQVSVKSLQVAEIIAGHLPQPRELTNALVTRTPEPIAFLCFQFLLLPIPPEDVALSVQAAAALPCAPTVTAGNQASSSCLGKTSGPWGFGLPATTRGTTPSCIESIKCKRRVPPQPACRAKNEVE